MAIPVVSVPHDTMQIVYQAQCIHVTAPPNTTCGWQGLNRLTEAEAQADWADHIAGPPPLQHEGIVLQYITPKP
jgi:hypothetical protein